MEHNTWVQIFSIVGSLIFGATATAIAGRRGGANSGFLMNQGRSRISNAVGRSNTHANNTSEAEGILIETAKMSVQDRDNAHKQAHEFVKLLLDANYRLGKAEAKAEILEKEKFPESSANATDMFLHNPLFEPQVALEDESPKATPLPEKPLEEVGNADIEVLPKSKRKPHLFAQEKAAPIPPQPNNEVDGLAEIPWNVQPIGEPRNSRRSKG